MGLLAAVQFLTTLPVRRNFTNEQVGRSTAYFPVVGIIIGLILLGLHYVLNLVLPTSLVSILLVAALVVLSGGLHLDGLADTMDGMAGHRTPERRLEIMHDSRIGGVGAVGLALFLIIEYVSLNSIPEAWKPYTLLLAPAVSRWAMVNSIFAYPCAGPGGLGSSFKQATRWRELVLATSVTVLLAVVLFRVAGLVVMAAAWLAITVAALYFKHQLRGLTGDTYGAVNEIALVAAFLAINTMAFRGWLL